MGTHFVAILFLGTRRRALRSRGLPPQNTLRFPASEGLNRSVMFRLPNLLTLSRILLVPVFVVAFLLHTDTGRLIAFAVFCLAGVSDALDGFAARRMQRRLRFRPHARSHRRQDPGGDGADVAGGGRAVDG